jgi:phage terminase large subunit-like protein
MAKKDKGALSLSEMLAQLTEGLSTHAEKPNLYGYKPYPQQENFHSSQKFGRIFCGGNQSGKTTGGTVEAIWWATKRHPYRKFNTVLPMHGRICCVDFMEGMEKIVLPEVKRWVLPSDLKNGSWLDSWDSYRRTLTFEDGSDIEFLSYEQDLEKHAGTKRNFIYFDEEPPEAIFGENMARLLAQQDAGWWIAMTPIEGITWIADRFIEPKEEIEDVDVFLVDTEENIYLPPGTVKRTLGNLSEDEKKIRQHGSFIPKGGRVYPEFQSTIHAVVPDTWRPPEGWAIWMSMDAGMNNPTCILWTAVAPNMESIVTFNEIYASDMIVSDIAKRIKEFETEWNLDIYCRTGDPAMKQRNQVTGTSMAMEMAKLGYNLALDSIPKDVTIGVNKIKQYLRPNPRRNNKPYWEIVGNRCPTLVDQMKKLQWDYVHSPKQRSQQNKPETIKKYKDHAPDAIRYNFTCFPDLSMQQLTSQTSLDDYLPWDWQQTLVNMANKPANAYAPVGKRKYVPSVMDYEDDWEVEFYDGQ